MRIMPRFVTRLPGTVVQLLGIRPGEKVIAWGSGPGPDGGEPVFAAATSRALYAQAINERLPWDRISKASWEAPTLELIALDDGDGPSRVVRLRLDDPRDLPAAVHDRVTASVVISEHVDLVGGAGALLVARRASDEDPVRWSVAFDRGLDADDPQLREAAGEALDRLRAALGI
jgi:hypothetical protein